MILKELGWPGEVDCYGFVFFPLEDRLHLTKMMEDLVVMVYKMPCLLLLSGLFSLIPMESSGRMGSTNLATLTYHSQMTPT